MDTIATPPFDALIKFRTHSAVVARLNRIAARKGKRPTEVYREAAQEKADREEKRLGINGKKATA